MCGYDERCRASGVRRAAEGTVDRKWADRCEGIKLISVPELVATGAEKGGSGMECQTIPFRECSCDLTVPRGRFWGAFPPFLLALQRTGTGH